MQITNKDIQSEEILINILTKEGNTHEKSNIRSYR